MPRAQPDHRRTTFVDILVIAVGLQAGLWMPPLVLPGLLVALSTGAAIQLRSRRALWVVRASVMLASVVVLGCHGLQFLAADIVRPAPMPFLFGMALAAWWFWGGLLPSRRDWRSALRRTWAHLQSYESTPFVPRHVELEGVLQCLWPVVQQRLGFRGAPVLLDLGRPSRRYRTDPRKPMSWALPCASGAVQVTFVDGWTPSIRACLEVEGLPTSLCISRRRSNQHPARATPLPDPVLAQLLRVRGVDAEWANRLLADAHGALLPAVIGHGAEIVNGAVRLSLPASLACTEIMGALESMVVAAMWLRDRQAELDRADAM